MAQNNLFRHEGDVTRDDRQLLLGHKGATLWFTGLSGCGKVPFSFFPFLLLFDVKFFF